MKRFFLPAIIVLAVGALIGLFVAGNHKNGSSSTGSGSLASISTSKAPWPAGNDPTSLKARLDAIGLPALTTEGSVLHIHQHLDVYVNGQKVSVPADIGVPPDQSYISIIHTHDDSAVLHVESPTQADFTLGQFFDTWGVKFDQNTLGGYKADSANHLKVYSNGQLASGDPRKLKLTNHQEIVVTFGTDTQLPNPIPSSYNFPSGL